MNNMARQTHDPVERVRVEHRLQVQDHPSHYAIGMTLPCKVSRRLRQYAP